MDLFWFAMKAWATAVVIIFLTIPVAKVATDFYFWVEKRGDKTK